MHKFENTQCGYWKVLEMVVGRGYRCVCVCGTERILDPSSIRSQRSKSCGCMQKVLKLGNKAKVKLPFKPKEKYE